MQKNKHTLKAWIDYLENMDAMEKMDDLDDGSIPDLTEIYVSPEHPIIETECCNHENTKDSNELENHEKISSSSESKLKESRQKLKNTYDKFCNGIKVTMSKTTCLDDTQDTGRYPSFNLIII